MLLIRDRPEPGRPGPSRGSALAHRRVADGIHGALGPLDAVHMRHYDSFCAGIQDTQDELGVVVRHADDRGYPGKIGGPYHLLHHTQIKRGVLHVDKSRIEPGYANDLNNLRVGHGHVLAQSKPALPHELLNAVLSHQLSFGLEALSR